MPSRYRGVLALLGLVTAIALLLILFLFGMFNHVVSDQGNQTSIETEVSIIATPEVAVTATEITIGPPSTPEATEESTEAPTSVPTTKTPATPVPTEEATPVPTIAPTIVPTVAPTQVPSPTPTPEPAVQATWHVVNEESGQPINQAMVWLAFNQDEPAQIHWADEDGNIVIKFDEVPNLGQNGLGYAVFEDRANPDLLKTELWFRLDSSSRELILVDQHGKDLDGPIELFSQDRAGGIPDLWPASRVWADCDSEECATEIALTSGSFRVGDEVSCHAEVMDGPNGSYQRFRMGNGMSVVNEYSQQNLVDPRWPDGEDGSFTGWECGNEKEKIFVVGGCGNIAIAVKPAE